ncbi:MAG: hypothetical protein ACRDGL_04605, partial [Candidatus Limnocylindrales bacterium]
VPAREILARSQHELEGEPVPELPDGLPGWAVETDVPQPARASRALSGVLVADGRILLVTITGDDLAWARRVWSSIRYHATEPAAPTMSRRRAATTLS